MAAGVSSTGRVTGIRGALLEAQIPLAAIGSLCGVERPFIGPLLSEVVSFRDETVLLAPFDDPEGITSGCKVVCYGRPLSLTFPRRCEGRLLNFLGSDLEDKTLDEHITAPLYTSAPPAISRIPVSKIFSTGVTAIDTLCTLGEGQRVGLFAPAGAGKSTLLSMLARNSNCDLSVIALIGERGREVREFLGHLGSEGRKKSVVIVATGDESPLRRILAANAATAISEFHRKEGKNVLLLFDSLTRFARGVRDLALAKGETPIRHGYPAAVFSALPRLVERAGNDETGSITAVYTVLTNGEDLEDPLAEEIKSILDGHIVLSAAKAAEGIRPAIDCTKSISRLNAALHRNEVLSTQRTVRRALFRLDTEKDLITLGGAPDEEMSAILKGESALKSFLSQAPTENRPLHASLLALQRVAAELAPSQR